MVRIVEMDNVTYSDYSGRLSKAEIEKEVKRYATEEIDKRKVIVVYRGKNRTFFIWKRVK